MNEFLKNIDVYYSEKIQLFGPVAKGVDWKDNESQQRRFYQLTKLIQKEPFSVLDYGCGYGALYDYLIVNYKSFIYTGFDISSKMIAAAIKRANNNNTGNVNFTTDETLIYPCDYTIASGIFNVRLDYSIMAWEQYIADTLYKINSLSIKGFAFNMLPSYCDEAYKKDYLYYGELEKTINTCKDICSGEVIVLKDYSLYEFTILVNKV